MGLRLLYKRGFLISAGILLLLSCKKEAVESHIFHIHPETLEGATKTLLVSDQIENKITSTVLAAYSNGRLYRTAYFPGNGSSLPLTLENGQEYSVYALVNVGDTRSAFPEFESGIGDFTYMLTSYDSGPDCINSRGIPMAGSITVTGGDSIRSVGVKRLLAKVTANIQCDWPGASVTSGRICNMNSVLKPFGTSAMASSSDSFSFSPERHDCISGSSSVTMIFYVPENIQGTVAGIVSSNEKTHEHNAAVNSMKDRLTYIEVCVSGNGLYDGEILYRSYLGSNSTDNFDIVRNCSYTWNITYGENNLSHDEWKIDNSLDDRRELSIQGTIYLIPGEDVTLGNYISTNMPLETIGWQLNSSYLGTDLVGSIHNGSNASGLSFTTDNSASSDNYGNRVISLYPLSNPRAGLGGNAKVYMVSESASWQNTLSGPVYNMITGRSGSGGKYFVTPGKNTNTEVEYDVEYLDDDIRERVSLKLKGKCGERWSFTESPDQGISGQLLGEISSENDVIRYEVESTVLPGDYPVRVQTKGTRYSDAFIHVNDTRQLRWVNRSSVVPGESDGVIAYKYLSENKIVVLLKDDSGYSTAGGTVFTQGNSPFQFTASDRSAKIKDISSNYNGLPFEGDFLHSGNYSEKIGLTYDGSLATKNVYNNRVGNKVTSGMLTIVPRVTANLADIDRHVIRVTAKNGYDDNTSHAIEAVVRSKNGLFYELALTPAISRVTVGATVTLTATRYFFRVVNNSLILDNNMVFQGTSSSLTWSGAPNGVFTATHPGNYRVTATFADGGTAYADIEVTSSDVDVSGDWDNGGTTILD